MKRLILVLVVCAVSSGIHGAADACSTFCFVSEDGPIFGKNYDWTVDDGLLIVNKRGVAKVSMAQDNPACWTPRFGSITFNQYGREFPSGGMNEAGLVVELMWLDDTEYPERDDRAGVTTLQWIQYQLDNCATVDEVIATDDVIRITRNDTAPIHFLVADGTGACAAIEFLDGRLVPHTGKTMPFRALTNDTYVRSAHYTRRFAGTSRLPRSSSSLDRFVRAAHMSEGFVGNARTAVAHAFGILSDVAQGNATKWSIVYDISARRINFKTHTNRVLRFVDLRAVDFSCDTPVMIVDLNARHKGDLSDRLVQYQRKANFDLIVAAFDKTDFLSDVSVSTLQRLARYPESMECDETAANAVMD